MKDPYTGDMNTELDKRLDGAVILDEYGRPLKTEPDRSHLEVIKPGQEHPSPEFGIETTPGAVCEHMAVLRYKEHRFEEPLPPTFMTWDETSQQLFCQPVMLRLALLLKPILDAEDEPAEQCGQCGAEVIGHHACLGVPGEEI